MTWHNDGPSFGEPFFEASALRPIRDAVADFNQSQLERKIRDRRSQLEAMGMSETFIREAILAEFFPRP
jgi:hypothetical protein